MSPSGNPALRLRRELGILGLAGKQTIPSALSSLVASLTSTIERKRCLILVIEISALKLNEMR